MEQVKMTTDDKKALFLEAFIEQESILKAADAIGIGRYAHGEWLRNDPQYRERFGDCVRMLKQKWLDEILSIARTQAVKDRDRLFGYALALNNLEGAQIDAHIPPGVQMFLRRIAMLGTVSPKLLDRPEPDGGVPCATDA